MKKNLHLSFLWLAVLCACILSGCGQTSEPETEPLETTAFKLNTVVQITIYDSREESLLEGCLELCDEYEAIFSRTSRDSELYKLNHRELSPVPGSQDTYEISQPLAELLSIGLEYSEASQGAFDVAIAPLTSLWDFTAEDPVVPDAKELESAISSCGYEDVRLQGQRITLPSRDTAFDLGAIAKGYIADRMKEYLVENGVHSAIINLGGNVLCIGQKTDGTAFRIGIQKPFADYSETAATMEIRDCSVVSSGIYERCFEKDGQFYHHILNPKTGYPYDNDLIAVTIVSDSSVDGDALSTTCFALGYEEGLAYAESLEGVQAIFITKDYEIHYTKDFRDEISVTDTAEDTQ